MDDIIPIGKYKGQPIETLAKDKQYAEWLISQAWFQQKYQNLYSIIINNFQEPSETPEHNKIQVKFLDDDYCIKLASVYFNHQFSELSIDKGNILIDKIAREYYKNTKGYNDETIDTIIKSLSCCGFDNLSISLKTFEYEGSDVRFNFYYGYDYSDSYDYSRGGREKDYILSQKLERELCVDKWFIIEIKPTISDDFPKVLRQIKNSKCNVLFISEYTGIGATTEQMINFFKNENIKVIFEKEVDQWELPAFLKEEVIYAK